MNPIETNSIHDDAPDVYDINELRNNALELLRSMTEQEILKTIQFVKKNHQ